MRSLIAQRLVAGHRWMLIAGTTLLAVASTFLIEGSREVANWLILLGAAVTMYMADVLREIEMDSRELARASDRSLAETRVDLFDAHAPRLSLGVLFIAIGLVGAGLAIR